MTEFTRDQETRTGTIFLSFRALQQEGMTIREVLFSGPRHVMLAVTAPQVRLDEEMAREVRDALDRFLGPEQPAEAGPPPDLSETLE